MTGFDGLYRARLKAGPHPSFLFFSSFTSTRFSCGGHLALDEMHTSIFCDYNQTVR